MSNPQVGGIKVANCAIGENLMERLTEYEDTGLTPEQVSEMMAEWVVWKNAECNGRLIELPCKIGDTLYVLTRNYISTFRVTHFTKYKNILWINWELTSGITGEHGIDGVSASELGKSVFLTREDAKAEIGKKKGGARS